MGGQAHIAFDPTSTVVTTCLGDGALCFFDVRKMSAPFLASDKLAEALAMPPAAGFYNNSDDGGGGGGDGGGDGANGHGDATGIIAVDSAGYR